MITGKTLLMGYKPFETGFFIEIRNKVESNPVTAGLLSTLFRAQLFPFELAE